MWKTTLAGVFLVGVSQLAAAGPGSAFRLQAHPENPRWLTADGGTSALVLSGAHSWSLFQDYFFAAPFGFRGYLGDLRRLDHNFTRGWYFEDGYYSPLPYARDGRIYRLSPPYESRYVKRLKQRIRAARKRGLFVSVMLFQGWSMDRRDGFRDPDPWPEHPYNRINTSERVTKEKAALHIGLAQEQQLEYVSYIARSLCREPNIIWEIVNEAHPNSLGSERASNWQNHILERLRSECRRHLIWVSCPFQTGLPAAQRRAMTRAMMSMDADVVTPCRPDLDTVQNPTSADGEKVIIADSDHFIPAEVGPEWVWRAFLRGQHPIFMDLTHDLTWWNGERWNRNEKRWKQIRRALGAVQEVVAVVEEQRPGSPASGLAEMAPQRRAGGRPGDRTRPASSEWALFSSNKPCPARRGGGCRKARANGDEILVYAGPRESVRVCRLAADGSYRYRWKRALRTGFMAPAATVSASDSGCVRLENPSATFSILHLERM